MTKHRKDTAVLQSCSIPTLISAEEHHALMRMYDTQFRKKQQELNKE